MEKMATVRSICQAAYFRSSLMAAASNRHFRNVFVFSNAFQFIFILCFQIYTLWWDELPDTFVQDAKKALSKSADDKAGQEILKNVFCAAETVEEFSGIIMSIKIEIDDSIGLSGGDIKPFSDEISRALRTVYQHNTTYLDSFGPDEAYLRKKVEMELGSKMIFLKMRCSGLGSECGKVSVLGTLGLAGSYVEQRA